MMAKASFYLAAIWVVFASLCSANRLDDKEIERRIDDLLSQMTIAEKLGQLSQVDGNLTDGRAVQMQIDLAKRGLLGSSIQVRGAANTNALQRAAMESRLKIPILFTFDVIHGYRTLFPIPLGEAASWDLEAAERSASIAAAESRAAGIHWTYAPMVDVSRDARWGRVMEGAGEDTFLGAKFAEARVKGFQGTKLGDSDKIIACAKHFAAYGAAEAGKDYNTVDMSERRLRETIFPPFQAAIDAGVASIMTSYNELNGVPTTGDKWLMQDVLRGEMGFNGILISDWNAVIEMLAHGYANNNTDAAMKSLNAGVDVEMVSRTFHDHGEELLRNGFVKMDRINEAVRRVLRVKYQLGLFDKWEASETMEQYQLMKPEYRAVARETAAKSFVLLKNQRDTLPIDPSKYSKIAVIGSLASEKNDTLSWWPADARGADSVSILEGIQDRLNGTSTTVSFSPGCNLLCNSTSGFEGAWQTVAAADFVVVVVGETKEYSGEGGSRTNIELPGYQLDLLDGIRKLEKPFVVIVKSGRPLALQWLEDNVPAILAIWRPGTMEGAAVADVLFGDVNPSGKLPMTFPRNVGQIPIHYDRKNTGRPANPFVRQTAKYLDSPVTPLYPFGYGLSYTKFEFTGLQFNQIQPTPSNFTVNVTVENVGNRNGTEVVQLYVQDVKASVTRPVRELRGFQRVALQPGEKRKVTFELTPKDLGMFDSQMNFIVEAGDFHIFVGNSSDTGLEGVVSIMSSGRSGATKNIGGIVFLIFTGLVAMLATKSAAV